VLTTLRYFRDEYEALERELAEIHSLAAASQPVVELGSTENLDILLDLHGRLTPQMAIRYGEAFEPYNPFFLEEPCQAENPAAMAPVARALTTPIGFAVALLLSIALGPANFLGVSVLVTSLAFASLGASGMAAMMGRRLLPRSEENTSEAAGFLRGAIALELAAAFPVIGWFLAIPIITLCSLGAAAFAVLGWMPEPKAALDAPTAQDQPALGQA